MFDAPDSHVTVSNNPSQLFPCVQCPFFSYINNEKKNIKV